MINFNDNMINIHNCGCIIIFIYVLLPLCVLRLVHDLTQYPCQLIGFSFSTDHLEWFLYVFAAVKVNSKIEEVGHNQNSSLSWPSDQTDQAREK